MVEDGDLSHRRDLGVEKLIEALLDFVDRGWVLMRHPDDPTNKYRKEAKQQYLTWLRRRMGPKFRRLNLRGSRGRSAAGRRGRQLRTGTLLTWWN
jgi:hypothetical protein